MASWMKCFQARGAGLLILIFGMAACDFSPALHDHFTPLNVTAGHQGLLPAVVDIRRSETCPAQTARFSIRFSKPMNRGNLESALGFYEVLGDAIGYDVPVNRDTPIRPNSSTFRWQDQDRLVTFDVALEDDRQYVLLLPETVTDKTGHGLDGRVGADVQGNGEIDIQMDEGQYARIDDDYLRAPRPFISLPIFMCSDRFAPSIWRTPLNHPRPRVMEFAGLIPSSESTPRYTAENGYHPFTTVDGGYDVERPLPPAGVLRLRVASENTAPTKPFGQRRGEVPVLPSTIVEAMDLIDENLASRQPVAYMDDRLLLPAPVRGRVDAVLSKDEIQSDALDGIPDGILEGMTLVARGRDGYRFLFLITGNDSSTLTIDPVWIQDSQVNRPTRGSFSSDNAFLHFGQSQFREGELVGLDVYRNMNFEGTIAANTGREVRVETGTTLTCAWGSSATLCEYWIEADLEVLDIKGSRFEIIPDALMIQTASRNLGQIYSLLLNIGEEPIRDVHGFLFVDGREDGNEQSGEADDRWTGAFPSGDFSRASIPPTLQLNDGRWYSPFPEGPQAGETVILEPYGEFTYLSHGIYGEYVSACVDGSPEPRLRSWAMTFATPNGGRDSIGSSDLLELDSVGNHNFAAFRMDGRMPESIGISVTSVTVHQDVYLHQGHSQNDDREGTLQGTLPTTLVLVEPLSTGNTMVIAGDDGVCDTNDDKRIPSYREWRPGDRLLISNRIRYSHADDSNLDGNYDGILSSHELDDIRLEYQGPSVTQPFDVWR